VPLDALLVPGSDVLAAQRQVVARRRQLDVVRCGAIRLEIRTLERPQPDVLAANVCAVSRELAH
jgi:hypothetical protein